ncbi:hypothetical protein Ahy_A03g013638 isoform B [Arachis hypogaea]|uniref:Uncharacterized protein n=1 Tax=Arachis hypogaea TaxID=3818 RepID=A0A445DVT6_ARAHY|nr:hypothetical protein Ahy_A03g013638 isoform B [Arachis hypogaea]
MAPVEKFVAELLRDLKLWLVEAGKVTSLRECIFNPFKLNLWLSSRVLYTTTTTIETLIGDRQPFWISTTLLGVPGWKRRTKLV